MNMEADDDDETEDVTLATMTGFAPFVDAKPLELQWIGASFGNYGFGDEPRATFAKNKDTPGFWSVVKSATTISAEENESAFHCSLEKSAANLGVTTAIKEGGSIHMKVGYKDTSSTDTDFAEHASMAVAWAAEEVEETDDGETDGEPGGDVAPGGDGGDENDGDEDDGATSVTAFGAAVIAAISALAF